MKDFSRLCASPTLHNNYLFSMLYKSDIFNSEVIYLEFQLNSYPWNPESEHPYLSKKLLGLLGFDYKLI